MFYPQSNANLRYNFEHKPFYISGVPEATSLKTTKENMQRYQKKIDITNATSLKKKDIGFNSGFDGILLKIGHEVEPPTASSMYSKVYNMHTNVYNMPVSLGKKADGERLWVANIEAVIDTGCTTTTLYESIIG